MSIIVKRYTKTTYTYKGVDLTGLLGDIKEDWGCPPAGSRGGAPVL